MIAAFISFINQKIQPFGLPLLGYWLPLIMWREALTTKEGVMVIDGHEFGAPVWLDEGITSYFTETERQALRDAGMARSFFSMEWLHRGTFKCNQELVSIYRVMFPVSEVLKQAGPTA